MATRTDVDSSDLRRALDVMVTVARRELLVEMRHRNKFALDLTGHLLGLAPILLTVWAVTAGGRPTTTLLGGAVDWTTFVLLGYIAFAAFGIASPVISFTGMAFSLHDEQVLGTLERNLLAPAPRIAIVLGSGVYYTGLFLFHVVSLMLISVAFLGLDVQWSAGVALQGAFVIFLILVLSIGFGILSSALLLTWKDQALMMILVHRPMLLLSGAYFLIPNIPEPFRSLAWLNPIAYAIDA
ncbi:MAG TPA: ABC transporter permease, partial [Chloroflexota bacterium]|nr:ABC transporter permease [Chloroflexota bacterium]